MPSHSHEGGVLQKPREDLVVGRAVTQNHWLGLSTPMRDADVPRKEATAPMPPILWTPGHLPSGFLQSSGGRLMHVQPVSGIRACTKPDGSTTFVEDGYGVSIGRTVDGMR